MPAASEHPDFMKGACNETKKNSNWQSEMADIVNILYQHDRKKNANIEYT